MRRRWPKIMGGALVIGAATVLTLALFFPRAPFRFLDGHEPVKNVGYPVYTFRADKDALVRVVAAELQSRGYPAPISIGKDAGTMFVGPDGDVAVFFSARWAGPPGSTLVGDQPGWITVAIYGSEHRRTLWARIKAVFGL